VTSHAVDYYTRRDLLIVRSRLLTATAVTQLYAAARLDPRIHPPLAMNFNWVSRQAVHTQSRASGGHDTGNSFESEERRDYSCNSVVVFATPFRM
jgi:hypothetical protein